MLLQLISTLCYVSTERRHAKALWMMKLWMNLKWSHKICPDKLNQGMSWDPRCTCGWWHVSNSRQQKAPQDLCLPMCRIASVKWLLSQKLCFLAVLHLVSSQQRNLRKSDTCHFRTITLKKHMSFLPSLSAFTRWMGREQRSLPQAPGGESHLPSRDTGPGLLCEWKGNFCCTVTEMLVFLF